MRHASIATTQKYLHVDETEMVAAVQAIGRIGYEPGKIIPSFAQTELGGRMRG